MEKFRFIDEVSVKKEYDIKNAKKKSSKKKTKEKKTKRDPRIESEYFEDIEMTDPLTGKKIIQRVKVVRYKTVKSESSKGVLEEEADDLKRTLDVFST